MLIILRLTKYISLHIIILTSLGNITIITVVSPSPISYVLPPLFTLVMAEDLIT